MKKSFCFLVGLVLVALAPVAMAADTAGSDEAWNITGPKWYDTKCGLGGFAYTYGIEGTGKAIRPCSVQFRVCEWKGFTLRAPAQPDFKCEAMLRSPPSELQKTYLVTWD